MDDLISWLRAVWDARLLQLDEDERVARAAARITGGMGDGTGRWQAELGFGRAAVEDRVTGDVIVYDEGLPTDDQAQHIARWDPARVLEEIAFERAEVEAKRRILDLLAQTLASASEYFTVESCDELDAILAEQTMRLLAQPYAGHPGWRAEWAA